MLLSPNTVLRRTPQHVAAGVGADIIVLHLQNGKYFGLQNVSARVWELLQGPVTMGEIEAKLREEYDVDPGQCHEELERLVSELIECTLVEVSSS